MRVPTLARVGGAVFFLLSYVMPSQLRSQTLLTPQAPTTQDSAPKADLQPNSDAGATHILYTGKLLGYFRTPNWQSGTSTSQEAGCGPAMEADESPAAKAFDNQMKEMKNKPPRAILVGTGDNFAPELKARVFCPPPADANRKQGKYAPPNKELYDWDKDSSSWIWHESEPPALQNRLMNGNGTVPTDNVGGFLRTAGYVAVVPGKHDFYFGPERLRELARFLASPADEDKNGKQMAHPVQMLGANLVIETTWKNDHKPVPDTESPPWFIPGFPSAKDLTPRTHLEIKLVGLSDGGQVYPWFSGPTLQIPKSDKTDPLVGDLNNLKVYVCESSTEGRPDKVPDSFSNPHCHAVDVIQVSTDQSLKYELRFPWQDSQRTSTVTPGENYGLCVDAPNSQLRDREGTHTFCVRFSVYTPFFQYPWGNTAEACPDPQKRPCFRDPEPYVFIPKDPANGRPEDVAIFGVVDPDLGDYVGTLNFAWWNTNGDYKTTTAIKEPAEALDELLCYFERKYELNHPNPHDPQMPQKFDGIKILLAQMTPQRAEVLAARVKEFAVVVSAADPEQATSSDKTTIEWAPKTGSAAADQTEAKKGARKPRSFVAVPKPYYDPTGEPHELLQIGSLDITRPSASDTARKIESRRMDSLSTPNASATSAAVTAPSPAIAPNFWATVATQLGRDCLPPGFSSVSLAEMDHSEQIGLLTLCAMQKDVKADVALIQKRDLFPNLPAEAGDAPPNLQQILDRIVWKGDFLRLMYVPGSALVKVMKQSKTYDEEDTSKLSLSDETQRGLIYLGIHYDSGLGEYVINEVPLDPDRLYAVATSDFIGAGDTGYPDFAAAAVKPPVTPRGFGNELETISSVVCKRLAGSKANADADCIGPIKGESYFDESVIKPTDQRKGNTAGHHLWAWNLFVHSKKIPGNSDIRCERLAKPTDAAECKVEQRGLGSLRINPSFPSVLAIEKATFSISTINHKFTDAEVSKTFLGSNVPQLTARRQHIITFDIRPKYTYSWHLLELFQAGEFRYGVRYKGQAGASRTMDQTDNLLSSDTGLAFHTPGRGFWHLGPVGTFHYETQLWNQPLSVFQSLAGSNTTLVQPVDKGRTHYLLPRVGLRFVNRTSWIEAGLEDGEELKAVHVVTVPAPSGSGTQTFLRRSNLHVSGTYWNWHLVVPFAPPVSWIIDEDGQYFFNNHADSPTDTRFLSDAKTGLNFQVWPSLSFAPTYEIFTYSNKVEGIWYWQGQASIQMNVRFDFWNHRQWTKQIQYKPSGESK